ncbi:MAG: PIN domain-containing protein [Polyangiaceae bacterium]
MAGVTLDSGALIAFERSDRGVLVQLKEASRRGAELTVPAVVIAEAWRGGARSARIASLIEACVVELLDEALARLAGEAMGKVKGAGVVDAIVMASAAKRGDYVLTSDPGDLLRLKSFFPAALVIAL